MKCAGFAIPFAFQNRSKRCGINSVRNVSGDGGSGLRRCARSFASAIDGYSPLCHVAEMSLLNSGDWYRTGAE